MSEWAVHRRAFPWILLAAPVAAWVFPGQTRIDPLTLSISCIAYAAPAAFLIGWPGSSARIALAELLFTSKAGKVSLLLPEIALPFLAGVLPSLMLAALWGMRLDSIPWQLWVVIPFSTMTAVSLLFILEEYLPFSGRILFLMAFMSQAVSAASWTLSPVFQLVVPHGYILWTLRWAEGNGAAFHGDIYVFFAVLEGIGLLLLASRILSRMPEIQPD
jgi:hypothetical protein